MPIVDIEIVLKPNEAIQSQMTSELANQLGEIFESPKGGTWVKVRGLIESQYAENEQESEEAYPVFISVLKSRLPTPDEMQIEVEKLTAAVAQIYGRRPENVHVLYEPEGRGRLAFGGKPVT
jgi:phenylpyruvate tautomerase PptA (4-oxalocrotonate tautomerase family)